MSNCLKHRFNTHNGARPCPYCQVNHLSTELGIAKASNESLREQLQQAHRQGWEQDEKALCANCKAEGLNVRCDLCTDIAAIRKVSL